MEAIMKKKRPLFPTTARPAPAMAVHSASHAISKPKPKIRIIHIFAPEIIKTDAANFRELVQRLTGKPATEDDDKILPPQLISPDAAAEFGDRKPEMGGGGCRISVKKEEGREEEEEEEEEEEDEEEDRLNDVVDLWNDVVGFEGFIEELGEFPLLPSAHQIMHGFEETQFA